MIMKVKIQPSTSKPFKFSDLVNGEGFLLCNGNRSTPFMDAVYIKTGTFGAATKSKRNALEFSTGTGISNYSSTPRFIEIIEGTEVIRINVTLTAQL